MNTMWLRHPDQRDGTGGFQQASRTDESRPRPGHRWLRRLLALVAVLAAGGATVPGAEKASAAIRGPDGVVHQVVAGCDPFLDTVTLSLPSVTWSSRPPDAVLFHIWSYTERRFVAFSQNWTTVTVGNIPMDWRNPSRNVYVPNARGQYAVRVTYYWVSSDWKLTSHTEDLTTYSTASLYGGSYPSTTCLLG